MSNHRMLTYKRRRRCIKEWAKEAGISPELLRYRLNAGWSMKDAMTTEPSSKPGRPKTMRAAQSHVIANHRALEAHLSRELRRFMKAFTDGLLLHAEVSLRDSSLVRRARSTPGEGRNFRPTIRTGPDRSAIDTSDLEIS